MKPFAGGRIGVLRGGHSTEREVSLRTGAAVAAALARQGYRVQELEPDVEPLMRAAGNLDAVFISLHGQGGEDGRIQAVLEWLKIPYTGSGVLASAVGMDKVMSKRLMQAAGLPTPAWQSWRRSEPAPAAPRFPVVVKPASEGSTVGVSIVQRAADLPAAIDAAGRYDGEIMMEDYIDGHELTVGVLDGAALPAIEVIPAEPFYNYTAKYTPGHCDYQLPPIHVKESTWREAQQLAARLHRLIGCAGATRVDFRIDAQARPFLLEINTVPGMTETSLLPKAAKAAGLSYDELVVRILESAQVRATGSASA